MSVSTSPESALARSVAVRFRGLATALPPFRATQRECLAFILDRFQVRPATKELYRRVLENESIETRHFALDDLAEVLDQDQDRVRARFEKWAVRLSAQSLRAALDRAGLAPKDLDFLAVTTCTGYLCPGLAAYLVDACGLRPGVEYADLVGMGCAAAVPGLRQAAQFVSANPGSASAVVSTEICSAAMFSDDAADLVVSNAIFADGSAAAVLGGDAPADDDAGLPRILDFRSLTVPEWRDSLRFRTDGGRLRNVLAREVPDQAARALAELVAGLLAENGLAPGDVSHWLFHAGGDKVLNAIESALRLDPNALASSRRVLKRCGNLSSPTVLFVLEDRLAAARPRPGERAVLASFGAGFSAHAALLEF